MPKYNTFGFQKSFSLLLSFSLTTFSILQISPSSAENLPQASNAPLELNLLTKPNGFVVTANTINPQGLTVPSLWWPKENSENKLLDNWIAYPSSEMEPARVDLIVNQQIWGLLDYLERYEFVNRLGSISQNFGYNVRVFNYQKEALATYTCNRNSSRGPCNIQIINQSKVRLLRK